MHLTGPLSQTTTSLRPRITSQDGLGYSRMNPRRPGASLPPAPVSLNNMGKVNLKPGQPESLRMQTTSGLQTADSPRARTGRTQGGYANSYNDTSPCLAASWLEGGATSTSGSGLFLVTPHLRFPRLPGGGARLGGAGPRDPGLS